MSLHLDLLVQLFNIDAELLVRIDEVVDRPAGMQHSSVVFVAAVKADGSQGRFGVLFGEVHGQLPRLNDFPLPGLGVDGVNR